MVVTRTQGGPRCDLAFVVHNNQVLFYRHRRNAVQCGARPREPRLDAPMLYPPAHTGIRVLITVFEAKQQM